MATNLKNITELPVAESAEGLNLIVNDNGAAKQIAASAVGAQADWAETDENSPAFIKNKPVEEFDLDISLVTTWDADGNHNIAYTVNSINTYANIKNKILNGKYPNLKWVQTYQPNAEFSISCVEVATQVGAVYYPANYNGSGLPEYIAMYCWCFDAGYCLILTSDDVIQEVGLN